MPAIICGSGPSLAKNVHELKEIEDKALLIAGGTALSLLPLHGVRVDFAAMIDPELSKERFKEDLDETPLFYQNRVDRDFLKTVQGPLFWMQDAGSSLIERGLFEEKPFDGGWNVVTFSAAIATSLGCNPIIFVGMDLSARPGEIYAPGVKATKNEEKLMLTHGENAEVFYSKQDWLMARTWLEKFAKMHPQIRFLNATEGGIGVPGIENLSLSSAKDAYLQKTQGLKERISKALDPIFPIGESEEMMRKVASLKESFSRARQHVDAFLMRMQEVFPSPISEDGKASFILFELEEESAYKAVLEMLWQVWKEPILRENPSCPELQKILLFKRVLEDF